MEISCQQCGTVFSVDPDMTAGDNKEVVCPGCFQFHVIPTSTERKTPSQEEPSASEPGKSPLGDGGVVDRLRDGFTLSFEVRHPAWSVPRKMNPYQIKQQIYEHQFDGQEEFREKAGRWFSIGEHPEFALIFKLIGLSIEVSQSQQTDSSQRKFTGWKRTPQKGVSAKQAPDTIPLPINNPTAEPHSRRLLLAVVVGLLALAGGLAAFLL